VSIDHNPAVFVTAGEFKAALDQQGGVCAVCHKVSRRLVVDHDSEGAVRGVLCHDCKAAKGMLHNDPRLLRNMIDYLRSNGGS